MINNDVVLFYLTFYSDYKIGNNCLQERPLSFVHNQTADIKSHDRNGLGILSFSAFLCVSVPLSYLLLISVITYNKARNVQNEYMFLQFPHA